MSDHFYTHRCHPTDQCPLCPTATTEEYTVRYDFISSMHGFVADKLILPSTASTITNELVRILDYHGIK